MFFCTLAFPLPDGTNRSTAWPSSRASSAPDSGILMRYECCKQTSNSKTKEHRGMASSSREKRKQNMEGKTTASEWERNNLYKNRGRATKSTVQECVRIPRLALNVMLLFCNRGPHRPPMFSPCPHSFFLRILATAGGRESAHGNDNCISAIKFHHSLHPAARRGPCL